MYETIKLDQQSYGDQIYPSAEDLVQMVQQYRFYFVAFDGCKPRHNILNVTRLTLIHRDRSTHCQSRYLRITEHDILLQMYSM